MTHPLDGARLKIVRADEHLKSLDNEIGRYISTEPYDTVVKREGDFVSVEGVVLAEPPLPLACIIGDVVTNLRASLDYVAWELYVKFGPATLTDGQKRRITFPIVPQKTDFAKPDGLYAYLRDTCKIPALPLQVIESVQPFNTGYETLNSLDLLVRIDKHRVPWLCVSFIDDIGEVRYYKNEKLVVKARGLSSGMNFGAHGRPLTQDDAISVKVDRKPTALIAIKDFPSPPTLTYVGILADILKCVSNIIPRFDNFF